MDITTEKNALCEAAAKDRAQRNEEAKAYLERMFPSDLTMGMKVKKAGGLIWSGPMMFRVFPDDPSKNSFTVTGCFLGTQLFTRGQRFIQFSDDQQVNAKLLRVCMADITRHGGLSWSSVGHDAATACHGKN